MPSQSTAHSRISRISRGGTVRRCACRAAGLLAAWFLAAAARADGPALQPGDLVGICGDNLTLQAYPVYMQDYLQMCRPAPGLQVRVFGQPTSITKLADSIRNEILPAKLKVATLSYGVADVAAATRDKRWIAHYGKSLTDLAAGLKAGGTRFIVIASPPVMDEKTNADYAKTVGDLTAAARAAATAQGVAFADVNAVMTDAESKIEGGGGKIRIACVSEYNCPEGGQFLTAYALLKALGCTGDIGTITYDMKSGQASATDGHKILGVDGHTLRVESTRYPFCFEATDYNRNVRPLLEVVPFNEELNRFVLVVKNAPSAKLKVTWGKDSREFTADQLAKGINLAAEFLDNPFLKPFAGVEARIADEQKFQGEGTSLERRSLDRWLELFPDEKGTLDHLRQILNARMEAVLGEQAKPVAPVDHEIEIEPE